MDEAAQAAKRICVESHCVMLTAELGRFSLISGDRASGDASEGTGKAGTTRLFAHGYSV